MFTQAILAFLILPGTIAFLVPVLIGTANRQGPLHLIGLLPFSAGCILLCWCIYQFYTAGKGTLAPWSPPTNLVVNGPYRWSRNPMYVGVCLIILGWAGLFWCLPLLVYLAVVAIAFHLRTVLGEEPWLARRHGPAWTSYRRKVRRWL